MSPSLTCGKRRIALKEAGSLFYFPVKVKGAARHAIEVVAVPEGPPGLTSIPDDFVQKEGEVAALEEAEKQGGGAAKTPRVVPALTSSARVANKQRGEDAKTPEGQNTVVGATAEVSSLVSIRRWRREKSQGGGGDDECRGRESATGAEPAAVGHAP